MLRAHCRARRSRCARFFVVHFGGGACGIVILPQHVTSKSFVAVGVRGRVLLCCRFGDRLRSQH